MSSARPSARSIGPVSSSTRVAIVAARFNADIVDKLLAGCQRRLTELGVDASRQTLVRVPGAFELPSAADMCARQRGFDAIIAIGCVIRGDTPHFDYVAGNCAAGLMRVGIDHGLPVIFGVLTTNTHQQAVDRSGGSHGHAGVSAAEAAVEMIGVQRAVAAIPQTNT